MKLINHKFKTIKKLEDFIDTLDKNKTVFIQMFCGIFDSLTIQDILNLLNEKLPDASIIGTSTSGEISKGKISKESILISFSVFDNTLVDTYYVPIVDFENGKIAAEKIIKENTKACIAFCEGLKSDPESFIDGFSCAAPNVPLSGGSAGDNFHFDKTFVIHADKIYNQGIVLAVLNSDVLRISSQYLLDWTPVGKVMTITKADKNIVYEIDDKPIEEIFQYYLGEDILCDIPTNSIEFPLVKMDKDILVARSIIKKLPQGGFVFAGQFKNGEKVQFAIGNPEEILTSASKLQSKIIKNPVEASYIYSCSSRKLFLKEQLDYEFGLIADIAPISGFITYGEFAYLNKNRLLNISTITLSLSESDKLLVFETAERRIPKYSALKFLTHLANRVENELQNNILFLNQYKIALDESSIVSKTDKRGIITYTNDKFCEISGYSREELIGEKHSLIRHKDTPKELFQDMWKTITNGQVWRGNFKNRAKNGEDYYVKSVIFPIHDQNNNIVEYMAVRTNITDVIKKEEIIKKSFIDNLTGLQNRQALLTNYIDKAGFGALLLINLDRFSEINDYFGYDFGDEVLRAFAGKLEKSQYCQNNFRISGDEFAVLLKSDKYDTSLKSKIIKIVEELENNNFVIHDDEISIDASFGFAFGYNGKIYNLSHSALKEAKIQNKNIVIFNEESHIAIKIQNNIDMIHQLKLAIKEDRIVPYFQGIVDNKSRKIIKYEALIRLIKKDGSLLMPFFFLEQAKKTKIYPKLTQIMIKKSFEFFANLDYDFSINFIVEDMLSLEIKEVLFDCLETYNCGNRLIIEIIESEEIEKFHEVKDFINEIRSYGCKIAIDDFGSGYSNFSYLSELSVDYLKIDGSLIKNIDTDTNQRIIVESILYFAKSQGIKTIAEFVENEAIFNKVVELGIDESQGYLFSKPSRFL
ncbi:MAG: EAL domain-containing protein [Sulfurospirillaceae bacterium]|nr:EAL domain-containing protein [Sulfurospirillaceae bacterium]